MTSTLPSSRTERRQRVVATASTMLRTREVDQIQMKDVAEGAAVALGTVYNYFSSKEQLFGEVLLDWARSLGTGITRRPLQGTTPAARLEDALLRSARAFQRRPPMARLLFRLQTSDHPIAAQVLDELGTATVAVYLGALDGLDPDEAHRVVRVADAVLDSALRAWSWGHVPFDAVTRLLSDAVTQLLPDGRVGPPPSGGDGSDAAAALDPT
jgi:TetR/AcrR family transcriptional regulator, cholesterol catabolism regulator